MVLGTTWKEYQIWVCLHYPSFGLFAGDKEVAGLGGFDIACRHLEASDDPVVGLVKRLLE